MVRPVIEAVVFDVGRVLVDFGYQDLFPFLREHGAAFSTTEEFIEKSELLPYEHGRISTERFIANVRGMLTSPAGDEELRRRWVEIFSPIREMIDLAMGLKAAVRVYLLSNTNELHWAHLQERHRLFDCAHGAIASFEVGAMKPDPVIYEEASRRFGLDPARSVFVDDIQANVEGAIRCGWHGVHHVGVAETRSTLADLGVPGL